MTSRGRVLITGASIAGPALAYWLRRYGFEPTVLERAERLRSAGQNIDVRGAGREVVRRMGLEDAVREATTGEVGTRFVAADGSTVAEFPAGTHDSDGATAELEILRGQLAALLVASDEGVDYVYGDRVERLEQDDDGVRVDLAGGGQGRFDLVVVAEGMRSHTRDVVLGMPATVRDLGLCTAYAAIPRTDDDVPWWRWLNAPGGRSVTLRPDNTGTTRAGLAFLTPDRRYDRLTGPEQLALLRERFAGVGWAAPRVLDALAEADAASELYLEHVGQVRLPSWSRGRVALVGDAAYCASPVSGMGTSLALTGAYVLAGELASHMHHRDAFAAYERLMRPYVEKAQDLPPGTPRVANPRSRAGIAAFHTVLRLASLGPVQAVGGKLFSPPAEAIDLPDYTHLETTPLAS